MRSSAPAEMSLSRRFLSLPQELPGASLPPQVAGQRCGTVTLCVPHILSSAVSSRPLPRVALVRVRWWGEQAPDSLFRPSLLSADGGGSSHRATAMKYPVNVQPAQLVEYFEDMRHLTLDVIDRDARKKVGECRLSLELERDNAVMTAEEKLVALRRDNALCEIKPTGAHEQDEVLGYLAVSFDVQWTDETKWRSREQEESEQVEEADRRVISVLDEKEEEVVVKKENREESGRSDDFQRIQKLLAKGKTLQQSMERAVREKENGEGGEVDVGIGEEGGGYFNAVHELASYSDFTSITGELDEHQPRSPASKSHIRPAPSVARENKGATQVNNGIDLGFLKHSENGSSGEANDGEVDSFDLSSISSSRSEENLRPKYQGDRSFGKSNPQSSPAITHSQVQHQVRGNDYPSKFAGSELFQFGVMIDDVSNVKPFAAIDRLPPSNCDQTKSIVSNGGNVDSNVISQEAASISLHYSVPSVFTRMSQPSIKFERTVRRKLRSSRWPGSTPSLSADFMGSIHVFQSVFAYDASEYFSDGYLIVEAWLQYTNAESTLLGLSKLPLRDFAEFFRSDEVDLLGYRKQILPIASVDGKFAIENPFTGHVAGYLHVRVSMGTAEQLLVWATTIKAIVRLQSVVRGALYRKQPDRPRYDLMNQNSRNPVTDATDARVVALSTEDSRSDSQSTAPTIAETTRMIAPHEKCTSIDMGEQRAQNYLDDPDAGKGTHDSDHRIGLRKIRFDVRECWRSSIQQKVRASGHPQQHGWRPSPLLGCEVQGQLELTGTTDMAGGQKGMGLQFALWWDAADRSLNSSFAHTFHVRGAHLKSSHGDIPVVGHQSQVLFALHVQNGFLGTQSRETIMGEARLNLYETIGKHAAEYKVAKRTVPRSTVDPPPVSVDVPIEWDRGGDELQRLPTVLPLKISYYTVPYLPGHEASDPDDDIFSECYGSAEHRGYNTRTASARKRLPPARIVLSLKLLSLAAFNHLFDDQVLIGTSSEMSPSTIHLLEILRSNGGMRSVQFDVVVCLGSELHEREEVVGSKEEYVRNTASWVFSERGRWYKRWRSSQIALPANGNNQIDLSNEFRMQARIVLDPEVVAILQEECAEVVVLVWCSTCSKLHEIGHAEVPLAAVLFRPQGVKGMFPIRVGTDPSGSRIGVHCFVDHFPHSPRRDISEPKLKLVTQPLMSPTSPDEALHAEHSSSDAYLIKNSCEVCIEEGRNMDAVDANVEYPGFYATFRVTYDEVSRAVPHPRADIDKRTEAAGGICPQWNYRAVFSVGDNRWRSLSLEVSVWQCVSNQRDRLDGFGSLGAGEQFDNPKGALLVGKLRVDLSLFAHGWRDINGWYHVLDDQLQRRGQIKVHITNLSVADTMRTAASINSISDDFPNASKYLQLPHEVHDGECGLFDEDGAESHSSSDKYTQAIYQNPEALRTQQKNLKVSGQTPLQTPGKVNDFAIVTYDSMQMYGDVERFLSLSHSAERKASLASQGAEPGVDQLNREKVSSDSEGAVDVLSTPVHNSNTDCEFHQEGSTMSANDIRSNSDDSDGGSLAINTEFFKPITLASFGIEEMELSPFGVDEEMSPDKFAAPSTTAILPQTCEDLEHGAMSGDVSDVSDADLHVVLCAGGERDCTDDEIGAGDSKSSCPEIFRDEHRDDFKNWDVQNEQCPVSEDGQTAAVTCELDVGTSGTLESGLEMEDAYPGNDAEHSIGNTGSSGSISDNDGTELRHDSDSLPEDYDQLAFSASSNGDSVHLNVISVDRDVIIDTDHQEVDAATLLDTMTRVSEEVAALRNNIVTAGSIGNEGGLEDPLCANDDAPSECAPKSTLEIGVGKDKDTVHLPETIISSPARAVEYADKAVQVDLGDLNVQVEVVDEPPRGLSVNYTFGDTSRNGEGETFADGERSTVHVDVGCEAMQTASNSITDEGECQIEEERSSQKGGVEVEEDSDDEECQFKEEASSQNGGVEVDEESGDEDSGDEELRDVWKNDVVDATVDSPDSLYDKRADGVSSANASSGYPEQQTPDCIENSKNDHESTLPTMQNEKLELVYEMLREMRDSYFGKLLTKPSVAPGAVICGASDMQPVYDKSSFVSHEGNVGDKRCSCPSPTASTVPISPKARELIFDESIARDMPSSIGLEQQAFVHSSKRISPPQLPAVGLHNSSIPSALRSSLRSTDGVNQFQVSAGIRRLSSSDIPESKARYSRQAVEKDGHSSVHSLFAHDSETERIARIMQGSMNYWMKDDSSSSCDDGEIDEEETDDDCYF